MALAYLTINLDAFTGDDHPPVSQYSTITLDPGVDHIDAANDVIHVRSIVVSLDRQGKAATANGVPCVDGRVPVVAGVAYAVSAPNVLRSGPHYIPALTAAQVVDLSDYITPGAPLTPDQAAALTARIVALEETPPGSGVTVHGALTGLGDDDHTQYALADGTRGAFAAPLGADDNYVTDAEKAALHAHSNKAALDLVSGTNTGDQTLPTWSTIAGKPAVVAAGIDAAAARTAIGAGTSSIVVGTGAGDAKAGNYQPTAANISDSTTTGRALLTAVDAAAARTTLALGTAATTASTAYATAAQGAKADTAVQPADLTAHAADATGVHGIADTAALVLTSDARLSDARTPTTHTHDDRYFTETESDGRFVRTVNGTGPDGSGNVTVAGGGGGVTDHGALTGLGDDDHAQYALADGTRGSFAAPSHTHTAAQISDSTATGRTLITAATATAARTAISAAPALGADDNYVTDAEKTKLANLSGTNTGDQTLPTWTTIAGKPAVVAAGATQADARTAIGAGTSSLVVGTGAGDAKAGNYQPTAANISDSTTTGRALLTAADAAAARTTLALGTAATTASTAYATTAQGAKADTAVQPARTITAGTGLTGGGDLSANRTLAVAYGTTSTTATVGNDSRVTGAIQASITDAKGDIIAATAADTVARVAVGSAGDSLTPDSSAGTGVAWAIPLLKVASTASTTIAPVLADHGKYQRLTAATAVTITLPSDATQAFPIGSYLLYKATAAGLATFVAGSSATLEDATPSAVMRAEGSLVQATKVAANTWTLDGDLA
jgi:hypothetical protein